MIDLKKAYSEHKDLEEYHCNEIPDGYCFFRPMNQKVGHLTQYGYLIAVKDDNEMASTAIVIGDTNGDKKKYWKEAEGRLLENYKNL